MHFDDAFRRRKAQLLDQQCQIDAEPLGSLNAASGTRMAQALFRTRKLAGTQSAPFPHIYYDRLR